jgi:predicted nucleotidyltransferase
LLIACRRDSPGVLVVPDMKIIADQQQTALRELCRHFRVGQLYLFGSATSGHFQPERSDLDFLVSLEQRPSGDYADDYLGLAAALEKLFGRPVDLLTERSIRNPYLRETILRTRQLLYDGRDEKIAA